MINRWLLIFVLGTLLIGCKAKKSSVDRQAKPLGAEAISKNTSLKFYSGDGLHTLPEDSGQFILFKIGSIQEYIETFAEIAQFEMKAYGIPASITLAQGLLESGFGRGPLAMKTNNHFGIKCHTGWEGDFDYHDDDEVGECFRKYNHPMYSFRDHSIFLSNRSRYAFLFNLPSDDYVRWAKGLRQAGYATDKRYPQKLIQLIEKYGLHNYDIKVVREGYGKVVIADTRGSGVHIVQKGDTLYSISRKYLTSVEELMRLNNLNGSTIAIGQELTIGPGKFNK